jgi:hypothetical protein
MRHFVAALLLFCVGLGVSVCAQPAVAAAQGQPAISMEARAGFDRAYRTAEWFPVVVSIANDGPDVQAILEWTFPDLQHEMTFRRPLDLPSGARKRVSLQVFAHDSAQRGHLRLLAGNATLAEQIIPLDPVAADDFLIGVISRDPVLLDSLSTLSLATATRSTVRHLDVTTVPEQVAALRGLNALFLHDLDSRTLTAAQRDALALWVGLGGQLIVSGGLDAQQTAAGLAELLPVALTSGVAQGNLTPLAGFAKATPPQSTAAPLNEVRPRAGAEQLPPNSGLLFRWKLGAGTVIFSAFDLAALRGWSGETPLWRELLVPINIFAPGANARRESDNLLHDVLQLPERALPSASLLLFFLMAYILVVGPLNYFLLRWLRRLEWAWITVPAAALLFACALYITGFGLRGAQVQGEQVTVVQAIEGQPRAFATAFIGLFSPRRATYTIDFPPTALVSDAREVSDLSNQALHVLSDETHVEVPNALVDVGAVRPFMAETAIDMPVSVQSELRDENGTLRGEIRNMGSQPLAEAMIVRGGAFQQLGLIAPGASQRVTMPDASNRFPWAVELSAIGPFNRQKLLSALFGSGKPRFSSPGGASSEALDTHGVYLLVWSEQPVVSAQINGRATTQNGLTLYFIRLKATS